MLRPEWAPSPPILAHGLGGGREDGDGEGDRDGERDRVRDVLIEALDETVGERLLGADIPGVRHGFCAEHAMGAVIPELGQ